MTERPDPPAETPPLSITMGEPGGIGAEITLKAWRARRHAGPAFHFIGDPALIHAAAAMPGCAAPVVEIADASETAEAFPDALPVLPLRCPAPVRPGVADPANASAVIAAIEHAVALTRRGQVDGIITNPIQKTTLYEAGFRHPGHTEYLAELAGGGATPVMMLATAALRVVPLTIHVPLRAVPALVTRDRIEAVVRITAAALAADFGVERPRVAVTGLNPHAGEAGSIGDEEERVIGPAVAAIRAEGIEVFGPVSADSLFHPDARTSYDAAVCMYHDQALIPLKTIDFWGGVNVTLGLPFVRTSPDHGTALDLAGTGKARAESLIAAIDMAAGIAARRRRRP